MYVHLLGRLSCSGLVLASEQTLVEMLERETSTRNSFTSMNLTPILALTVVREIKYWDRFKVFTLAFSTSQIGP